MLALLLILFEAGWALDVEDEAIIEEEEEEEVDVEARAVVEGRKRVALPAARAVETDEENVAAEKGNENEEGGM